MPSPRCTTRSFCVALSEEQAAQKVEAIDNHKRREETVWEMREITQTLILETVPGGAGGNASRKSQEPVKLAPFGFDPFYPSSLSPLMPRWHHRDRVARHEPPA